MRWKSRATAAIPYARGIRIAIAALVTPIESSAATSLIAPKHHSTTKATSKSLLFPVQTPEASASAGTKLARAPRASRPGQSLMMTKWPIISPGSEQRDHDSGKPLHRQLARVRVSRGKDELCGLLTCFRVAEC